MENETETSPKKKHFSWKGLGILFSALAVVVLLCVGYGAYMSYVSLQKMQIREASIFESDIQILKNNVDDLRKSLADSQSKQSEQMKNVEDSIQKIEQTPGIEAQFKIAEVDFLIKFANQTLTLDHNIPDTIQILKKADEALQNVSDTNVIALREALAKDIANLQSAPIIDTTGIYMRLNALNDELQRLPLITKISQENNNIPAENNNENLSWWKKGLQNTWDSLRSLVVVRYNTKGRMPLISPGQETFLYGLMTTDVMHAEWGLLHGNNTIYQTSLTNIKKYVDEYFVSNASQTIALVNELNALQQFDVQMVSKDISNSLQAVNALKKGE